MIVVNHLNTNRLVGNRAVKKILKKGIPERQSLSTWVCCNSLGIMFLKLKFGDFIIYSV